MTEGGRAGERGKTRRERERWSLNMREGGRERAGERERAKSGRERERAKKRERE